MTGLAAPSSMPEVLALVAHEMERYRTGDERTDKVIEHMLIEGGVVALASKLNGTSQSRRYLSLHHMVLVEGEVFRPQPFPSQWTTGPKQHCFSNALSLATERHNLTYCEGYGWTGMLVTMHGWCVDDDGNVFDPTWDDPQDGVYIGIRIPWHELFRRAEMVGNQQPIIDDWRTDYQWLHKGWKLEDHKAVTPTTRKGTHDGHNDV